MFDYRDWAVVCLTTEVVCLSTEVVCLTTEVLLLYVWLQRFCCCMFDYRGCMFDYRGCMFEDRVFVFEYAGCMFEHKGCVRVCVHNPEVVSIWGRWRSHAYWKKGLLFARYRAEGEEGAQAVRAHMPEVHNEMREISLRWPCHCWRRRRSGAACPRGPCQASTRARPSSGCCVQGVLSLPPPLYCSLA